MSQFQLQYEDVCGDCDSLMGVGEWAKYGSPNAIPQGVRHVKCPRQPKTCPTCFLQHNGECP